MSDRTSAEIFGEAFRFLAKTNDEHAKAMARHFWSLTAGYDFTPRQMDCDDALIALGLARSGVDPEWPNDGEAVLYEEAIR